MNVDARAMDWRGLEGPNRRKTLLRNEPIKGQVRGRIMSALDIDSLAFIICCEQ